MIDYSFGFLKNVAIMPFLTAAFLVAAATPAIISIAKYFNLVDDPLKRRHPAHTEERIIPRAGGLAIFLGFLAAVSLFIPFSKGVVGILLGALLLVVVGLIDDYRDVHPYIRLGVNFLAALLAVSGGAGISFLSNPLTGGVINFDAWRVSFNFIGPHSFLPIADFLAVVWIVWTMNMVGWSGGVDGQMPGFVTISAIVIGLLSFTQLTVSNFPAWTGTTLAFITAGAYLGFLVYNFYPQKIMPGYGGKSLAGYLLATLAILSTAKLGTAILVLGVPVIDAIFVKTGQIFSGKNPTSGSRNFLHHRLLDAGWSKRRIALFYWGLSAILGAVALILNARQKVYIFVLLGVVLAMVIIWLRFYTTWLKPQESDNG
ncbi:MAG: MraY family glycosyltransferase [bacterium]|nr:MraY family glycosyltransferase [bacterium]